MTALHRATCTVWFLASAAFAASSARPGEFRCGTGPDLEITERFRHQQSAARLPAALRLDPPGAPRTDIGNIAMVDDSEGAVVRPNLFDLRQRTLRFTPSGPAAAQYSASTESLQFDTEAAEAGAPLAGLQDDDSRQVRFPFSFPYYGQRYETGHLNSDGNLTFLRPDTAISSRSLGRAVAGPPRIFPFFNDLDPSQPGAAVRLYSSADRIVITWDRVPEYQPQGGGLRQTFQMALFPDGRMEFHYRDITAPEAVVGIAPGELRNDLRSADFSQGVSPASAGAIAEIFSNTTSMDVAVIARKFYRNHDDSYDYLVLYNNMGLAPAPGTFAFLMHIRNQVLGIGGLLRENPVFDGGDEFGSPLRLQSLLNLGPLSSYPANPGQVIPVFSSSRNTALTILGQESGHRFLAYPRFLDPVSGQASRTLLGRDNAHWSFFFHSDASVVEGNRIEDRGEGQSPRFVTGATVEKYGPFDQYLMGLRSAAETPPSFLVRNASAGFSSDAPRPGATFDGIRQDVTAQMIVNAEGRRVPDSTVAQRHFSYAFVMVVREGTEPSAPDLEQLDRLRTEWERFFSGATENRGTASTAMVKQLRLSTWPAGGVLRGSPATATVSIASPAARSLEVTLAADTGVLTVPGTVTIPPGRTSISFPISGLRAGVSDLTALAAGSTYEVSRSRVQVREDAALLRFETVSGANQQGGRGAALPQPVVLRLRDENDLSFAGVGVNLSASGDGAVTPARAVTDEQGRVQVSWRLATTGSTNTLRAALEAAPAVAASVTATALERPVFAVTAVVNAASFNTGNSAVNTGISPGSLVSIFGGGLAPETRAATFLPLPASLGGASVTVGGRPAPLVYVSPGQINLQAPFELAGPTAEIVVTTSGGASAATTVPVAAAQPGIFFDASTGLGAIIHNSDGRLTSQRPARAGDYLQIYATGLGAVLPPVESGFPAPLSPLSRTTISPQVTIAGRPAAMAFSGLAPGFAGLYQLTVQVPEGLPAGRQPVSLTEGGLRSNEVFVLLQ